MADTVPAEPDDVARVAADERARVAMLSASTTDRQPDIEDSYDSIRAPSTSYAGPTLLEGDSVPGGVDSVGTLPHADSNDGEDWPGTLTSNIGGLLTQTETDESQARDIQPAAEAPKGFDKMEMTSNMLANALLLLTVKGLDLDVIEVCSMATVLRQEVAGTTIDDVSKKVMLSLTKVNGDPVNWQGVTTQRGQRWTPLLQAARAVIEFVSGYRLVKVSTAGSRAYRINLGALAQLLAQDETQAGPPDTQELSDDEMLGSVLLASLGALDEDAAPEAAFPAATHQALHHVAVGDDGINEILRCVVDEPDEKRALWLVDAIMQEGGAQCVADFFFSAFSYDMLRANQVLQGLRALNYAHILQECDGQAERLAHLTHVFLQDSAAIPRTGSLDDEDSNSVSDDLPDLAMARSAPPVTCIAGHADLEQMGTVDHLQQSSEWLAGHPDSRAKRKALFQDGGQDSQTGPPVTSDRYMDAVTPQTPNKSAMARGPPASIAAFTTWPGITGQPPDKKRKVPRELTADTYADLRKSDPPVKPHVLLQEFNTLAQNSKCHQHALVFKFLDTTADLRLKEWKWWKKLASAGVLTRDLYEGTNFAGLSNAVALAGTSGQFIVKSAEGTIALMVKAGRVQVPNPSGNLLHRLRAALAPFDVIADQMALHKGKLPSVVKKQLGAQGHAWATVGFR